jgi:gluconolactonase
LADKLSDLVESSEPEVFATGFVFTEGPLWDPSGFLYVSDVDARIHYRVFPGHPPRKDVIRASSGGANGSCFDTHGNVINCEQDARRVVRLEHDGSRTLLTAGSTRVRLNRCNDIVCRADGSIYFTDPDKFLNPAERDLGHSAVWRLRPDAAAVHPGYALSMVASDINHPNGLAFSPDGRTLYVSNTRPDPHLHAYSVRKDGSLTDSRSFADMPYGPKGELDGVPDGLKVDEAGRIYCTGPGGVWVWSPDAAFVGIIKLPELPANLNWGDPDRRTLYVTARTSVYRLRMKVTGAPALAACP